MPTLILVLIWAFTHVYFRQIANISVWLFPMLYLVGFSIFAVTCHRLILSNMQSVSYLLEFNSRLFRFALKMVLVYVAFYLVMALPLTYQAITE